MKALSGCLKKYDLLKSSLNSGYLVVQSYLKNCDVWKYVLREVNLKVLEWHVGKFKEIFFFVTLA